MWSRQARPPRGGLDHRGAGSTTEGRARPPRGGLDHRGAGSTTDGRLDHRGAGSTTEGRARAPGGAGPARPCPGASGLRRARSPRRPGTPRAAPRGEAPPMPSRTACSTAARSPGATSRTQLVVHLQQHPGGAGPAPRSARSTREHRHLDDVGRRPLDRRVERHPLGHLAALPVVAGEVRQVAAAAEHRLGVAGHAAPRRRRRAGSRVRRRTARSRSSISARASVGSMPSCCARPYADSPYASP